MEKKEKELEERKKKKVLKKKPGKYFYYPTCKVYREMKKHGCDGKKRSINVARKNKQECIVTYMLYSEDDEPINLTAFDFFVFDHIFSLIENKQRYITLRSFIETAVNKDNRYSSSKKREELFMDSINRLKKVKLDFDYRNYYDHLDEEAKNRVERESMMKNQNLVFVEESIEMVNGSNQKVLDFDHLPAIYEYARLINQIAGVERDLFESGFKKVDIEKLLVMRYLIQEFNYRVNSFPGSSKNEEKKSSSKSNKYNKYNNVFKLRTILENSDVDYSSLSNDKINRKAKYIEKILIHYSSKGYIEEYSIDGSASQDDLKFTVD